VKRGKKRILNLKEISTEEKKRERGFRTEISRGVNVSSATIEIHSSGMRKVRAVIHTTRRIGKSKVPGSHIDMRGPPPLN